MEDWSEEDKRYCRFMTKDVLNWLEERVIESENALTKSFTVSETKNKFPTISLILVEKILKLLEIEGRITTSDPASGSLAALGHRSRIVQYFISAEMRREIVGNVSKRNEQKLEDEKLLEIERRSKKKMDRVNQMPSPNVRERKVSATNVKHDTVKAEDVAIRAGEKENNHNSSSRKTNTAEYQDQDQSPKTSTSSLNTLDFVTLLKNPVSECTLAVSDNISEILREAAKIGDISVENVFHQASKLGISQEIYYKVLNQLEKSNRIMVDWGESVIHLI